MPTEHETWIGRFGPGIVTLTDSTMRRAAITGSTSAVSHSISITNSSPPMRATVSPARTLERRRAATSLSTRSPTAWPSVSLTGLKPSRSMNSTTILPPSRPSAFAASSRRIACDSRFSNSSRFGRFVNGSRSAR